MMYDMPLYRPPSEANSLIIQATLGCSYNKCTFCSMYRSKKFKIKRLEDIKGEIIEFSKIYPYASRIFIADGDALIIKMEDLREILKLINSKFKNLERVTMYASPKSIKIKTLDELKELYTLGVKMVYMGIESGSNEILEAINKGASREEIIEAGLKIKESKIKLSATLIAGIGGTLKSKIHSMETGDLINIIKPNYLGILSLMVEEGTEIEKDVREGKFKLLSNVQILEEIEDIVSNINTDERIVFRSNHASNYVSLKGNLPEEKMRIVDDIRWCIKNKFMKNENGRSL